MSRNISPIVATLIAMTCLGGTLNAATAGKTSVKLIIPVTKQLTTSVYVQGVTGDIRLTQDKDLVSTPNAKYVDLGGNPVPLASTKSTFMFNLMSDKANGTIVLEFDKNGQKDTFSFNISIANGQATVDHFPTFVPDSNSPIKSIKLGGRATGLTDMITVTPN